MLKHAGNYCESNLFQRKSSFQSNLALSSVSLLPLSVHLELLKTVHKNSKLETNST